MATKGQYQSFALIAFDALKTQNLNVNAKIAQGCLDCQADIPTLYICKNVIETIFNYSRDCFSVPNVTEQDIVILCDYITTNLKFSTTPIPQLAETTLNTVS